MAKTKKLAEKVKEDVQTVDVEQKSKIAGQVARAHDCLVYGSFQGSMIKDVLEARDFLSELHKKMLAEIDAAPAVEAKEESAI